MSVVLPAHALIWIDKIYFFFDGGYRDVVNENGVERVNFFQGAGLSPSAHVERKNKWNNRKGEGSGHHPFYRIRWLKKEAQSGNAE